MSQNTGLCGHTWWGQTILKCRHLEQRKVYCRAILGERWCVCLSVCVHAHISCSVLSDSLWPHGLQPARLLCPSNFPGKNMENICVCKERGCSWLLPLKKNLNSLNAFSKIFLKTRWEGARMVVANFLMQESFAGVGQVTMSNKTVQQDECYSPFWTFFSSVHMFSFVSLFVTPWTATQQASPSITTPRDCSNSRPLSHIHLAISSSVIPFSSCLQSHPASGSFPRSQFFTSGGQRIGVQFQHQSFQWMFRTDLL